MEFASERYIEEVIKRLRENSYWKESGRGVTASFTLIIKAEPRRSIDRDRLIGFKVKNGDIVEVWVDKHRKTDFTLIGKYGEWVKLALGRSNPLKALLKGKIKVRGDISRLVELATLAHPLTEIFKSIPTKFHGSYNRHSSDKDP